MRGLQGSSQTPWASEAEPACWRGPWAGDRASALPSPHPTGSHPFHPTWGPICFSKQAPSFSKPIRVDRAIFPRVFWKDSKSILLSEPLPLPLPHLWFCSTESALSRDRPPGPVCWRCGLAITGCLPAVCALWGLQPPPALEALAHPLLYLWHSLRVHLAEAPGPCLLGLLYGGGHELGYIPSSRHRAGVQS